MIVAIGRSRGSTTVAKLALRDRVQAVGYAYESGLVGAGTR